MYTKKMYSKIRQCRPSPGQGTFVFIKWKRTSPAQLPLSDSPSMAGRAGPARVGSLWPPMGNRDLGGTTAHFSLIKLKRSFSFRRIKNLGWFSAELRVLPGELSPSLTQWITKSVCDSAPTITTGPAPCKCLWEGIIPNVTIAPREITSSVSQQEPKTAGLSNKILN